jgi:hypothetical protein
MIRRKQQLLLALILVRLYWQAAEDGKTSQRLTPLMPENRIVQDRLIIACRQ